ncbi:IGR protein motif protein [Ascosphaera apis ARSEF 7405]|uniref:Small ribosomal subunit protein mS41 n=1 Tax=Ascosphaera apis ARSEF 7405 TaxID=392613 RepID=A0A162IHE8_9EURO|nr:IGR protein motif protein [Ascosphaera apis ARSEF 7405]
MSISIYRQPFLLTTRTARLTTTTTPLLLQQQQYQPQRQCIRSLHKNVPAPPIPKPTPFVPDVPTFLKLIGRNMSKYANKISSWNDLFTITSEDLRALGIEAARDRKYLLRWRQKFRKGEYGVGGDLEHVVDGVAEVRAVEVDRPPRKSENGGGEGSASTSPGSLTQTPGKKWAVVNLPPGQTTLDDPKPQLKRYIGIKLYDGNRIKGPYLSTVKGSNNTAARIEVQEGMWEHKLGRKIHGGERKRAEVLAKKRAEERKKETA